MDLHDRMKKYERATNIHLVPRTPAIVRVDGRAFHTFSKGFDKPFDTCMAKALERAASDVCKDLSCVKLAYGQSDEISFLLIDYTDFGTQQVFDGDVSKICSVFASATSVAYNQSLFEWWSKIAALVKDPKATEENKKKYMERFDLLSKKLCGAMFDARVFNLPREEVSNYFLDRLNDAIRNSVQALGQAYFSHRELEGVNCEEIKQKLVKEKEISWNDVKQRYQHGFFIARNAHGWEVAIPEPEHVKSWMIGHVNTLVNPVQKESDENVQDSAGNI